MNSTTTPFRNPMRAASWLAVLALAWFQVSLAAHQFDHTTSDLAESCQVCAELDRYDDLVAASGAADSTFRAAQLRVTGKNDAYLPARSHTAYHSRAPPKL